MCDWDPAEQPDGGWHGHRKRVTRGPTPSTSVSVNGLTKAVFVVEPEFPAASSANEKGHRQVALSHQTWVWRVSAAGR